MKIKRSLYILGAAVGASILVLASCNPMLANTLAPAAAPASAGHSSPTAGKGGVGISVQAISPVVNNVFQKQLLAQGSSKGLSSKAYLGAGRVEFTVYDVTDTYVIDGWTVYPSQNSPSQGGYSLGAWYGAPYNGYVLHAKVYNQPGDGVPAVQGESYF
ncbi:MAG TPA: hypothetical protein VFH83_16695, partial [Spirochaetia bacterium]|nr:hypothetical protein [Spirochaetia bacterium]